MTLRESANGGPCLYGLRVLVGLPVPLGEVDLNMAGLTPISKMDKNKIN